MMWDVELAGAKFQAEIAFQGSRMSFKYEDVYFDALLDGQGTARHQKTGQTIVFEVLRAETGPFGGTVSGQVTRSR